MQADPGPPRRPPSHRARSARPRATEQLAVQRRRVEQMWIVVLRRFREHMHNTAMEPSTDAGNADDLEQ